MDMVNMVLFYLYLIIYIWERGLLMLVLRLYATQGCIQDPLGPENSLKSIDFTGPWNTYASDATNGETGGNLRCFILNEGFFCLNKREISEIHI